MGGGSGRGGVGLWVGWGGQSGCERRSEVFVKIIIFFFFFLGGGGGVRSGGGVGEGSKVWGRWVMWGMGDVNQE